MTTARPDTKPVDSFEWVKVVSSVSFDGSPDIKGIAGKTIKCVAWRLAFWANPDGSNVRPGPARVAVICEIDYKTAKKVFATLLAVGLLAQVQRGGGVTTAERANNSTNYQLSIPADLSSIVKVRDPDELTDEIERVKAANRRKVTGNPGPRKPTYSQGTGAPVSAGTTRGDTGNCRPADDDSRGNPECTYGELPSAIPTNDLPTKSTYHLSPSDTSAPSASGRQEEADTSEDQTQQTAAGIANHYRPTITVVEARRLTAPIAEALRRGWTADAIRTELDQPTGGLASIAAGLIARARQLGDPPAPPPAAPARAPKCDNCDPNRFTYVRGPSGKVGIRRCPTCHTAREPLEPGAEVVGPNYTEPQETTPVAPRPARNPAAACGRWDCRDGQITVGINLVKCRECVAATTDPKE